MLLFILSEDLVTMLGRIAAIILSLYLFIFVVFLLVVSVLLAYGNAWLRDQVGLLKKLRLFAQNIDTTIHAASSETLPATMELDSRVVQVIRTVQSSQVVQKVKDAQRQVSTIEKKVEPGADRVADAVIEFRARTVMVQGVLKAFFLPGLTKQKPRSPLMLQTAPGSPEPGEPVNTTLPAGGSTSAGAGASSNVVITEPNLPDGHIQPAGVGQLKPFVSGGTERADDAPSR
jgi:hypothetical protein